MTRAEEAIWYIVQCLYGHQLGDQDVKEIIKILGKRKKKKKK